MKITTKLLLGTTLVAGLSISAFAACATDVDMGAKKLTNVADGTVAGDAVNKGQLDAITIWKDKEEIVCDGTFHKVVISGYHSQHLFVARYTSANIDAGNHLASPPNVANEYGPWNTTSQSDLNTSALSNATTYVFGKVSGENGMYVGCNSAMAPQSAVIYRR